MRYLTFNQVVRLYYRVMSESGGVSGIRDLNALESAIAQPRMTFDGVELYPTLIEKAVALGFSLIMNHPFLDGNKRIGHAAIEMLLLLNGCELRADVAEQEHVILQVAAGTIKRDELLSWVRAHVVNK